MKISEVTIKELKDYAHVYHNEDDNLFGAILIACKSYISSYTGLPLVDDPATPDVVEKNCDAHEDLTIALFVLSNELYDNRTFTVENDKVNTVIKSILDMHSVNLL
jgi:hypothetical protein